MPVPTRIALSLLVLAACGTSAAPVTAPGPNPPQGVNNAQGTAPHVFTARSHPDRRRTLPPKPDLRALPQMVDRSRQCFGSQASDTWGRGQPPPPSSQPRRKSKTKNPKKKRASKGGKKGPGYVPYKPSPSASSGAIGMGGAASSSRPKSRAPRPDPEPARSNRPLDDSRAIANKAEAERRPDVSPAAPPPSEEASRDDVALGKVAGANTEGGLVVAQDNEQQLQGWGASTYLSNDDTMSLSSAQRVIYAIDHFLPLPAEHIRPHELLNYFSFDTAPVAETDDFSVHATVAPDPTKEGIHTLALAVRGRPMGVDDRRNANLAFVIDRSGSMASEGRMDYLKRGLKRSLNELKPGDLVHLVLFDNRVCTPIENFVVGRDSRRVLEQAIDQLEPRGATDLQAGLAEGYAAADRAYQPTYTNRVVMVTDAQTNSGVTDAELISTVGQFYDRRQIRLSGVGVGASFNDALLDRLTERGRGAYVFLGSPAEVDAVFGPRFVSLVETTALDVHFQLHLPPSLRMDVFYGEESSTVKEDVQAIHYFANTSQLFLSDVMARDGALPEQDSVMLTIEYDEPESGEGRVEEFAFNLGEMSSDARNVAKGRMLIHFVDGLAWMASRTVVGQAGQGRWHDSLAWETCEQGRTDLNRMSESISDDPEVRRVLGLWDKHCARYARPRQPTRRPPAEDTWPSAVE